MQMVQFSLISDTMLSFYTMLCFNLYLWLVVITEIASDVISSVEVGSAQAHRVDKFQS